MSFRENLKNKLEEIEKKFSYNNFSYFLNIDIDTETIQIIHPILNGERLNRKNEFGFSIYLPFDCMEHELSIFKSLPFFSEFSYFEFDGIPCYDLNCGMDNEKLMDYTIEILQKVFMADLTQHCNFEINY